LDWHVLNILVCHSGAFNKYQKYLGLPEPMNPIPATKTIQIPLRAIEVNQSTVEGNADIERNILRQCGLGEHGVPASSKLPVIPLGEHIILTHGDLGTYK
jgi:hypothetical protein